MHDYIKLTQSALNLQIPVNGVVVTYTTSLITNIIVFMGFISIVEWLKSSNPDSRNRRILAFSANVAFILYLLMQAVLHAPFGPNAFGNHWTFLNMILIMMTYINLNGSLRKLEFLVSFVTITFYLLITFERFDLGDVAIYLAMILVMWLTNLEQTKVMQHWWLPYVSNAFIGTCGLYLRAVINPEPQDGWFWFRQISAYAILAIAAVEYTRLLRKNNRQKNAYLASSMIDELTHINNFRAFNNKMEKLFHDLQKSNSSKQFTMFMLDLDHFKKTNDTYGHIAGNEVLEQVANTMTQFATEQEIDVSTYRVGGEEFVVLVENIESNPNRSRHFSNELLKKIRALEFHFDGETVHITASLGQAIYEPTDHNYLEAYKRADKALYASKEFGRNAYTVYGQTFAVSD